MFNIGSQELVVILFVVLMLFGAKRIPEVARSVGSGMHEFRKAMRGIEDELRFDDARRPTPRPEPRRVEAKNDVSHREPSMESVVASAPGASPNRESTDPAIGPGSSLPQQAPTGPSTASGAASQAAASTRTEEPRGDSPKPDRASEDGTP
jgi:sec-independent protein translocase protein TatA